MVSKANNIANINGPAGASLVWYMPDGVGATEVSVQTTLQQIVSVKNFGARGDGLGKTPADEGIDIMSESWNTWDGTPFKTDLSYSPYAHTPGNIFSPTGIFAPPRAKPFSNTDTWDRIGISLALWSGGWTTTGTHGKATHIPAGKYIINVGDPTLGEYNGIVMMKGQEQMIYGDGPLNTILTTKENAAFFTANTPLVEDTYKLLVFYRSTGAQVNVRDLQVIGPALYDPTTTHNLSLIRCENINGYIFQNLWVATTTKGFSAANICSDSFINKVTFEGCFKSSIECDSGTDFCVDFCNFWASAGSLAGQAGILAAGWISVTNSRFILYLGASIVAYQGVFNSNNIQANSSVSAVNFSSNCTVTGNYIDGYATKSLINVVSLATVTGNFLRQTAPAPAILLGNGVALSAVDVLISGNTILKTDVSAITTNYVILAPVTSVNTLGAATASCYITDNVIDGRYANPVGLATFGVNVQNGGQDFSTTGYCATGLVNTPIARAKLTIKGSSTGYTTSGLCLERDSTTDRWNFLPSTVNDLYLGFNAVDKAYISASTGAYTALSDSRVKKDITESSYGLKEVLQLRSVEYLMATDLEGSKKHIGLIAQEVKSVIDLAVDDVDGDRMYGLDKSGLVPVLIKAIQEQQATIELLSTRLTALEITPPPI